MTTHIIEVLDVLLLLAREQCRKEIELAGARVVDEKMNFVTNTVKFYVILNFVDSNTEKSLVGKLKLSPVWKQCSCMYKIERGTRKSKNLLSA